jgi:hypothetical protein
MALVNPLLSVHPDLEHRIKQYGFTGHCGGGKKRTESPDGFQVPAVIVHTSPH